MQRKVNFIMIALIIMAMVYVVITTGVKVGSVFQKLGEWLSRPPFA